MKVISLPLGRVCINSQCLCVSIAYRHAAKNQILAVCARWNSCIHQDSQENNMLQVADDKVKAMQAENSFQAAWLLNGTHSHYLARLQPGADPHPRCPMQDAAR